MHSSTSFALLATLAFGLTAFAGEPDRKIVASPETARAWQLKLSAPGWLAGLEGDIGIHGVASHVDVDPGAVIRRVDMAASLRSEASLGRFGLMADFIYLSLSDGIGTSTAVKKVDLQVDQIVGELAARYRLIDHPRGSLDLYGGVRYVNLFQQVVTQPNSDRIADLSRGLVNTVSDRLQSRAGESGLHNLLRTRIEEAVASRVPGSDPGRPSNLPIGPLRGRVADALQARVEAIIDAGKAALAAALRERAAAATAELQARAQARVDAIKNDLSTRIARSLETKLATRVARSDDWWDPFVGLRGRLNLSNAWYLTAKGDIGGFGVGSDFTWQVEGALGCQVTRHVFAEVGYRALSTDYEGNGLTYDVVSHGAQVTLGLAF